ncbi:MAG: MBL fold metallo-hydrolase [Armatimonadetes bacterium]|nr:MBL fold metallo-hydrolase [Armatimonadota bacterium]
MSRIQSLAPDLILIDTHYRETPRAIGSYLLLGEHPALIESGPASTLENLLEGVRQAGVDPRDLRAVAVTHIHLDHAGAAGSLARMFPHLEVYVHPVGASHLIDPARLVASSRRTFGEVFDAWFGEVVPVPAERVHVLHDGAQITLGSRRLTALDTPGHARHHLAYFDEASGDVFTGDVTGVAVSGVRHVRVPTTPPEFDPGAWRASIARLRALGLRRLLPTHFGPHTWIDSLLRQLEEGLDQMVEMGRESADLDAATLAARLKEASLVELTRVGHPEALTTYEVIVGSDLSAQGLLRFVTKEREREA